jgi:hypothetical protein
MDTSSSNQHANYFASNQHANNFASIHQYSHSFSHGKTNTSKNGCSVCFAHSFSHGKTNTSKNGGSVYFAHSISHGKTNTPKNGCSVCFAHSFAHGKTNTSKNGGSVCFTHSCNDACPYKSAIATPDNGTQCIYHHKHSDSTTNCFRIFRAYANSTTRVAFFSTHCTSVNG